MFENWKDKMKQWLDGSEDSSNFTYDHKKNQSTIQKMETKVAYQYPNHKKFNFPILPDEEKQSRRISRTRKVTNQNDYNKDGMDKQRRKPFRPTSVPSPVYGFQERPNQTNHTDVPAFLRKVEIKKQTEAIVNNESEQSHTTPLETSDLMRETEMNVTETSEINRNIQAANHADYQEKVIPPDYESDVSEEEPLSKKQKIMHSSTANTAESPEGMHHSEVKKRNKQPFNVRMQPSDKKRYYQKQQVNKQAIENNNKPPIHLLNDSMPKQSNSNEWVHEQAKLLENTLKQFHVNAKVIATMQGPTVTRFEVQPEAGVKVSKIKNLSDDIKLNMAAKDIRMEAPIPGKHAIGIEIPNQDAKAVSLQEIFEQDQFQSHSSALSIALGLDIAGSPIVTDIKKMPHGLIAGATGSGKSVCINTILISLLYKANHEDVKLMLIDPKMVELAPYNEVPHLVAPVITDVKAATHALKWAVAEMEDRYERFVQEGTRDIERYNQKMLAQQRTKDKMPYIVIVIDELADLMMVSPQDVEDAICRIAQKARACGIHLLLATQRPSVDVITGLIKANIPTRIAFSVSSQVDSRTIIDTNGAERLLGKGDMLFVENGARNPVRIQGAFVTDEEIERVTNYVKKIAPANYLFEQEELLQQVEVEEVEDELYPEVLTFVIEQNGASASLLQRRFKIGYNRAARLIDSLEYNGIISAQKGSKPRDVLVSSNDLE